MTPFNSRSHTLETDQTLKRRVSILEEFPELPLEAIVVQWNLFRPTVLIQLKKDPSEPVQFPGKRPEVPGNADLPKDQPSALDLPLTGFIDPVSGQAFGKEAFNADLLFSHRVFSMMQPEPDLVLPVEALVECRSTALEYLKIADEPWVKPLDSPKPTDIA